MEQMKKQGGLLARLQDLSGCQYLSDLHNTFYIEDVLHAVHRIKIASYSADEWMEAYRYITGEDPAGSSKEALAGELVRWLKHQIHIED